MRLKAQSSPSVHLRSNVVAGLRAGPATTEGRGYEEGWATTEGRRYVRCGSNGY